jgi:predicted ATPase/DNA-binding CsgD family transcriptional regulator
VLAAPAALPQPLTPLVGRATERAALVARLQQPEARLLTLTGPGGVGKTRLALAVAQDLARTRAPRVADGVYWVPLAALGAPEFVLPAIAQALGLRETGWRSLLADLQAALRARALLLLLDNLEHVLDATPPLADLLAVCPQVTLLVTSRAALRLSGELEVAVLPLTLPDPATRSTPESLLQSDACALFVARVQAIQPHFAVTPANAPLIAEICQRLDGLPLAIELAAASSRLLSPHALLARLTHRLDLLTGGERNAPPRHQTLRAAIAWSEQLLTPAEQRLFRWLSVCVGGCDLEAAAALGAAAYQAGADADATISDVSVLAGVSALADHQLLGQVEQSDGEPRMLMLQTIREFGLERLERAGELETAQAAHAAYYLALAEAAAPHLRGADEARIVAELAREQENLRAALDFLLEQAHRSVGASAGARAAEQALRLCVALYWYWYERDATREGQAYLGRALASQEGPEGVARHLRARALYAAAELAHGLDETEETERLCAECLALSQEEGDTTGVASALALLGIVARSRGRYALARTQLEEAAGLFAQQGDSWNQGRCQVELARTATDQGQYERARALLERHLQVCQQADDQLSVHWDQYLLARLLVVQQADLGHAERLAEQSLAFFKSRGYSAYRAYMIALLAQLRLAQGEVTLARTWFEESLTLAQEAGDREGAIEPLLGLARVALAQGDPIMARRRYQEGLATLRAMRSEAFLSAYLEGLAALETTYGAPREAARLWGVADTLRTALGTPLPQVDQAADEHARAQARTALGEQSFRSVWAAGRWMTGEQAVAQALTAQDQQDQWDEAIFTMPAKAPHARSASVSPVRPAMPFGLTTREVEVLRWLAQGLSDAQIAERLVISVRTVNRHTTSLYGKLGVSSRAAATRAALEQGLLADPLWAPSAAPNPTAWEDAKDTQP